MCIGECFQTISYSFDYTPPAYITLLVTDLGRAMGLNPLTCCLSPRVWRLAPIALWPCGCGPVADRIPGCWYLGYSHQLNCGHQAGLVYVSLSPMRIMYFQAMKVSEGCKPLQQNSPALKPIRRTCSGSMCSVK